MKTANGRAHVASLIVLLSAAAVSAQTPAELRNEKIALSLNTQSGSALVSIRDGVRGAELLDETQRTALLWAVELRSRDGRITTITSLDAGAAHTQTARTPTGEKRLTLRWPEAPGPVDVTVTGRLPRDGSLSFWRISVGNRSREFGLWEVTFPIVSGVRRQEDGALALPHQWGYVARDPIGVQWRYQGYYPARMSAQFLGYYGREGGLYFAAHDGRAHAKTFVFDARSNDKSGDIRLRQLVPDAGKPGQTYIQPYEVALGVFHGDWQSACALYRQWAIQQPWCANGPLSSSNATPEWFKRVSLWLKFYGAPDKVVREVAEYRTFLRTPMAVDYYRYPISRFDDNYPEMLPAKPRFRQGIQSLHRMGVRVMPYTNGLIWDQDTGTWRRRKGLTAAAKQADRSLYLWTIGPNLYARMCPSVPLWREMVHDTTAKLVGECDVDGVYLDCIACGVNTPCFDSSHGHPLGGGAYWAQDFRRLIGQLRGSMRSSRPEAILTSEGCCECFIDVLDGFLTLGLTRVGLPAFCENAPLFTAIYHDYAICFGSDGALRQSRPFFAWLMGTSFVWGKQMMLSQLVSPSPAKYPENAKLLRELTHAYHQAGRHFLLAGQWLAADSVECARTEITGFRRRRQMTFRTPVVPTSFWRLRDGRIGVAMVNITGKPQRVKFRIGLRKIGLAYENLSLTQLWPQPQAAAGRVKGVEWPRSETVPAYGVRLYELGRQTPPAPDELDDIDFKLLSAASPKFQIARDARLWACREFPVAHRLAKGRLSVSTEPPEDRNVLAFRRPHRLGFAGVIEAVVRMVGDDALDIEAKPSAAGPLTIDGTRGFDAAVLDIKTGAPIDTVVLPDAVRIRVERGNAYWIRIRRRGKASLAAKTGVDVRLSADHEWLPPFWPIDVRASVTNRGADPVKIEAIDLSPVDPAVTGAVHIVRADADLPVTLGFGQSFEITFGVTVTDVAFNQHVLTLAGTAKVSAANVAAPSRSATCRERLDFDVNAPLRFEAQTGPVDLTAGTPRRIDIVARNVSPFDLPTELHVMAPPEWDVTSDGELKRAILAGATVRHNLRVVPSGSSPGGTFWIDCRMLYNDAHATQVYRSISCTVLPRFVIVGRPRGGEVAHGARYRLRNRFIVLAEGESRATLTVRSERVTTYSDPVRYKLIAADMKTVAQGTIPVGKARSIPVPPGPRRQFVLDLDAGRSSALLRTEGCVAAVEASPARRMSIIFAEGEWAVWVPRSAKRFIVHVRTGGPTEPTRLTLTAPDGREAVSREGILDGVDIPVTVSPADAGRLWKLRVTPREDVSIALRGDVSPYMSPGTRSLAPVAAAD